MRIASRVVRASTPRGFSLVLAIGFALTAFVLVAKDAPAQSTDPCRSPDPSKWPASSKPYFMVALDTSGSMDDAVGSAPSCPGYPSTRVGHARCAVSNMVKAYAGEVNFGLATFPVKLEPAQARGRRPRNASNQCRNGTQDGSETGIDCGGGCLPCTCFDGMMNGTETAIDCGGSCMPCTCYDGVLNGTETAIDCGGACFSCQCNNANTDGNETAQDCGGPCFACTCDNGAQDGNETGVDCGGSCRPCTSNCTNGIKDGAETGVDCGGYCNRCGTGVACGSGLDCASNVCTGGVCQAIACPAALTGKFAGCEINNLWTGTCGSTCGNWNGGGCGTAQTGANQRSANILVPLPADDYWNTPPLAQPNSAALLSYVDNQCGDCKEIFSDGNTPLNGVLRDMFRYLSQQWRPPLPGTNADVAPAGSPIVATPLTGTERPCRSVNVILITDGDETCPTDSAAAQAQAAATALRNGWTIGTTTWTAKTYVIDVRGTTTPGTGSTNIATAGGTAPAKAAVDEVALSQALSAIITGANSPEVCDNADNNCNGCYDEGSVVYCNRNKTARTLAQLNAGPSNTSMCCSWTLAADRTACLNAYSASITGANPQGSKWFLPCWDANSDTTNIQTKWLCVNPGEVCDNADNNCETEVDKAQSDWNTNVVDETVLKCGSPLHCPLAETCNSQDDDCDGVNDNASGSGVPGSVCPAGCAFPTAELCNGCDDDCDGVADNGVAPIACGFSPPANCAGTRTCTPVNVSAPGACIAGVSPPGVNRYGACSASPAPDDTTCNSLDDNCNGVVDENAPPTPCTNGQPGLVYKDVNPSSQCVKGLQPCNGTSCTGWIGPSTEVCDGIDNDCDGLVDAADPGLTGVGVQCGTTQGICTKGTTACVGGAIVCQGGTQPQPEICDGKDNNCNGSTDETPLSDGPSAPGCWTTPGSACTFNALSWNFPPGATCSGPGTLTAPCQVGALTCQGTSGWACLGAAGPSAEVCDGVDNNCNGTADDGNPGGGGQCGSNVGICKFGTNNCVGGKLTCQGGTGPSPETCNTLDDDCNGTPDDNIAGLGQVCGVNRGVCKAGVTACSGGTVTCQGEVKPSTEICDGLDNNCDGAIDNNPADTPAALGCWNLPGSTCSGGGTTWSAPPNGTCTGLGTLTAPCAPGILVCSGTNKWVCQGGTLPGPEVCDGLDNNCNGAADDGNPGGGGTCGQTSVGVCELGTRSCVAGQIVCQGEIGPQPEICDGLDNNCDGTADNNVTIGVGNICGSSVGICNQGVTACVNGSIQCQGGTPKGTEVCNGLDDDCDGVVDNNLTDGPANPGCWNLAGNTCSFKNVSWNVPAGATCNTVGSLGIPCKTGTLVCVGTNGWACQGSLGPQPELCDGVDNNCNGQTDENNPGGGVQCGSGTGECDPGTLQCVNGALDCQGGKGPGPEVCDGKDNNCDGQIDEPANVVGVGQSCGSSVGVCKPGITACVSGGIVCQGGVKSSPEICDGKDNDCNGSIDDNPTDGPADKGCWNINGSTCSFATLTWDAPPNGTCTGLGSLTSPCTAGAIVCQNGAWQCQGGKLPSQSETCNGIDDDCNGQVDDGNPGGGGTCGASNVGQCKFGTLECFNGQVICRNEIGSSIEICDGIDNDCNGVVDNTPVGANAPCNGACGAGTTACVTSVGPPPTGAIVCQTVKSSVPEVCNGIDDDCNGIVDDNLTDAPTVSACWNNPGTTCNYANATWDPPPGATCTEPGTLSAACQLGKLRCDGVRGWSCVGGRLPAPEVCNGADDNCNGTVDENDPQGGQQCRIGGCAPGTQHCSGGILVCDAPSPEPEICDGKDNNCNGLTDEGVPVGAPCFPAYNQNDYPGDRTQGLCTPGQLICDPNGSGTLICKGGKGPSPEVCDNQDNDCDGAIDESGVAPNGIDGTKNPTDATQAIGGECGSKVGECKPGNYACRFGQFQCLGGRGPQREVCDCLDNDCDGNVDEDPTPNSGEVPLCGAGTACVSDTSSGSEVCMCAGPCGSGEFGCPAGGVCKDLPLSSDPSKVKGYCISDVCGTCSKVVKDTSGTIECGPPGTVDAGGAPVPPCTCHGTDGCHGPCHNVNCGQGLGLACVPSGTFAGECRPPTDCRFFGCPTGKACNADKCVDDPCDPNPCGANEACTPNATFDDHRCVGSCANVTCSAGERCVEGVCKPTGCATNCPSGQVCLGNGDAGAACGPSKCAASGRCSDGLFCEPTTGGCGNDPCSAVHCPANQACELGQCVKKTTQNGSGGAAGAAGAGGSSGAGATTGAGGTTDDSGTNPSGGDSGNAGSNNHAGASSEEPSKAVIGLATGGGGCRCELATQSTPAPRTLGLIGLALTTLLLRRQRRSAASEASPRRGSASRRGGSGGSPPGRTTAGAGGRECKQSRAAKSFATTRENPAGGTVKGGAQ
jgi:hypothetical protein